MVVIVTLPVTNTNSLLFKTFCFMSSLVLPSKRKERGQKNLGSEPQREGNKRLTERENESVRA